MSLFQNAFGSGQPQQQQQPAQGQQAAPTTPGNIPPTAPNTGATPPGAAPNGTIPNTGDQNPKPDTNPLAEFEKLWQAVDTDKAAPNGSIFGEIDPKKFMEAAGKIDFSKVISPEHLQAISQGGEAAVQAFASALNSVAQTTYAQSAFAASKIADQGLQRAYEKMVGELPTHFKKFHMSENLRGENPIFSNPAVQPVITAMEQQFAVKYPNASAAELTQMAKRYVESLGSAFSPKAQNAGTQEADTEGDWDTWLDTSPARKR
jgi:hypothetical protein